MVIAMTTIVLYVVMLDVRNVIIRLCFTTMKLTGVRNE